MCSIENKSLSKRRVAEPVRAWAMPGASTFHTGSSRSRYFSSEVGKRNGIGMPSSKGNGVP